MKQCHKCGTPWTEPKNRPAFTAACPTCRAFLHACKNCRFHEPGRHNQCRVPGTEMVRDRAGMNHCDAFEFREASEAPPPVTQKDAARAALDALLGGESGGGEADQDARDFLLGDGEAKKDPRQALDDLFGDK